MQKLISIILFIVISFVVSIYLPWYAIALIAIIISYIGKYNPLSAFLTFFILGFSIWFIYAYAIDHTSFSSLSGKIAILFGNQKVPTLLFVTGLIGGITAAMGGWTGSILKQYVDSRN